MRPCVKNSEHPFNARCARARSIIELDFLMVALMSFHSVCNISTQTRIIFCSFPVALEQFLEHHNIFMDFL